jgi:hypothetical protein
VDRIRKHPIVSLIAALAGVVLLGMLAFSLYLASATGSLPWQEDPTRIPVPTAFSNSDGFTLPTPLPTATHAP